MVTNKKQAILLSVMCLWFATAFIISCYHAGTEAKFLTEPRTSPALEVEKEAIRSLDLPPVVEKDMLETRERIVAATPTEWNFHWPSERRQHEDLTKLSLLVLPVFAICVPLWFIFRFSVLPRRAPTLRP